MHIQDYHIVQADTGYELTNKIKERLADGWELHGSFVVQRCRSNGVYPWEEHFYQAMVLPKEPPHAK